MYLNRPRIHNKKIRKSLLYFLIFVSKWLNPDAIYIYISPVIKISLSSSPSTFDTYNQEQKCWRTISAAIDEFHTRQVRCYPVTNRNSVCSKWNLNALNVHTPTRLLSLVSSSNRKLSSRRITIPRPPSRNTSIPFASPLIDLVPLQIVPFWKRPSSSRQRTKTETPARWNTEHRW